MQFQLSKSTYIVSEFVKKLGKSALPKHTRSDHLNFRDDGATVFSSLLYLTCFSSCTPLSLMNKLLNSCCFRLQLAYTLRKM